MPYKNKADKYKYNQDYAKDNLKRIPLSVPKSEYDAIKAHSDKHNLGVNTFIRQAVKDAMQRDLESPEASTDETTTEKE